MTKGADVTGIAVELTALARARALQQARALQASLKAVYDAEAELADAKAKYAAAADTYRTARAQARVHFSEADLLEAGARPLPRQRRTRA
jgi:hypothetical protein